MASSLGRNKLACFYCGVKSSRTQDGFIQQWECPDCLSVNFIDRNGNIMDPPASHFSPESSPGPMLQYAQKVKEPKFDGFDQPQTPDQPFCDTCLKNQHMYQSFISEYVPDHMDFNPQQPYSPDRKFINYKKSLQNRYPQVCADCQKGVDERIKRANRMAQAEVLRQRLDRTKTTHKSGGTRTWVEFFAFWGGIVYWAATASQVAACLLGLLEAFMPANSRTCATISLSESKPVTESWSPPNLAAVASLLACSVERIVTFGYGLGSQLPSLAASSIVMTISSFWWNPYYRNMIRGFDRHIHGFIDWYKYQIILLVTRIIFWKIMGKGHLSQPDSPATLGTNCFMLVCTIMIARISRKSIKVDLRKLFPGTQDVTQAEQEHSAAAQTSVYSGGGLLGALEGINNDSPRQQWQPDRNKGQIMSPHTGQSAGLAVSTRNNSASPSSLPHTQVSLASMSESEAAGYLMRGIVPTRMQEDTEDGEMEWSPSQRSRQLDFLPNARSIPLSAKAPAEIGEPSPFWFKVPSAPSAPSHKARNPFKKPIFQAVSEEKKENFFQTMTGRKQNPTFSHLDPKIEGDAPREMKMAPTKFFAQTAFETTGLEELMEKAFSLASDSPVKTSKNSPFRKPTNRSAQETTNEAQDEQDSMESREASLSNGQPGNWKTRLTYIVVLTIAFGVWNMAFTIASLETKKIATGIIGVCMLLAMRTLTDNTVTEWAKNNIGLRTAVGTTLGGCEVSFAAYLGLELISMTELDSNSYTKGAMLIGTMLVQELWFLLL